MMADVKLSTYGALMTSLNAVKSAADMPTDDVLTSAQRHAAKIDQMRKDRQNNQAISDGIARTAS
jgi:hypothetical protein